MTKMQSKVKHFEKILYCSSVCSEKMLDYLFHTSDKKPLLSIQKFHKLLIDGLNKSDCNIVTLSAIPISRTMHKKVWWRFKSETFEGIKFIYIPFINFPFIRQFSVVLFSFFRSLRWCLHHRRDGSVIICDILNVAVSASTFLVAKLCRIKICAIVTDIPNMLEQAKKQTRKSLIEKLAIKVSSSIMSSFDNYILLTEQMNSLINTNQKPYLVMEGLVDINMQITRNLLKNKALNQILIYAGGIYEEYGIKKLIEAFMRIKGDDLRLHIYGAGEMEDDMPFYENVDKRIKYCSVVPNHIIVQKEIEATLLINPRPSNQEFTKYSFPSKNMEYMVSGTPLITTALQGMPNEYEDFVFIFHDEGVDGMATSLKSVLSLSKEELHKFGFRAKQFVLEKKNNLIQAKRVLDLFEKSLH